MASNDSIFTFSTPKPRSNDAARAPTPTDPRSNCHSIVLDMGEASRLEGFRQNGCR